MSESISGKEALTALANGEELEYTGDYINFGNAFDLTVSEILSDLWVFRLKPRTITINGIAVPKPQKNMPENGDDVFTLDFTRYEGYVSWTCQSSINTFSRDWWKSEDEIKQVVAALRKVFKGE